MISIILGTFNSIHNIENLIENVLENDEDLELVIVDGGSTDGTVEFIKSIQSNKLKLIEYGKKSSYPSFMNLAIKNSSHDFICQWNADAILINPWSEIIDSITNEKYDFYIFNWKLAAKISDMNDETWVQGDSKIDGWYLEDKTEDGGVLTMNYGVYKKELFTKIGLYDKKFDFWFADGDLSNRCHYFGFKHLSLKGTKVLVLDSPKSRELQKRDKKTYDKNLKLYKKNKIPRRIEFLKS